MVLVLGKKKQMKQKKKSKVNKKLSQQPTTHYQFAPLSHVMAFFFSHGAAPLLLLLYYYRFVPLRFNCNLLPSRLFS
jgi:hypothetical protein